MSEMKHFDLIIGNADGEIFNGDVPIRWCITPEMVKDMEDNGVIDPHILIVSIKHETDHEMDRQLIPLTEMMTYLRFSCAGEHLVAAYIVNGSKGRKVLYNNYKTGPNSNSNLMEYGCTNNELYHVAKTDITWGYAATTAKVEIPDTAFGKEPPAWLKWYANLWHEAKVVDQCNFRQRMILAFTLKMVPFLIWTFGLIFTRIVVALGVASFGWTKSPRYRQLLRPYKYPGFEYGVLGGESLNVENNQYFITKQWKTVDGFNRARQFFVVPIMFTPAAMGFMFFVVWLVALEYSGYVLETACIRFFAVGFVALLIGGVVDTLATLTNWLTVTPFFDRQVAKWEAFDQLAGAKGWWPSIILSTGAVVFVGITLLLIFATWFQYLAAFVVLFAILGAISWWAVGKIFDAQVNHNDYTHVRELLCPRDPQNMIAKYDAIPRQQRSVRLWAKDLKNKVCKPMQI